jgi:biopolymer transport protein ExbB
MYLRRWLAIAFFVALGWALFAPVVYSRAQENGGAADAPAAAAAATEKPPAAPAGEGGFHWFLRCSGAIGLFIFGLSVYFVAVVIRLFMTMKSEVAVPPEISNDFRQLVGEGNFQGAYDIVRGNESFLGRVVAKGIEQLPNGLAESRHAMERIGESETVRMEKQISIMAVLGTLGPMIGLIGTLKGMITSFSVIAMSGVVLKTSEVAQGISEALLLTFEGVSLSVPAIYFFAFFRNRVALITMDAMVEADDLVNLFYRSGRSRTSAKTSSAKTPATPRAAAPPP